MMRSDNAFTPLVVPRVGETPTDLRGEAERARVRGYAEGYAEGRRAAFEEGRAEQAAESVRREQEHASFVVDRGIALEALHHASTGVERRVQSLSALSAQRIEELAVELASVILGVELSDPARSASHALRRALDEMPMERWHRVTLDPQDRAIIGDDAEASRLLRDIDIVDSPSVGAGGAIVEVEDGAVDTRIGRALQRAAEALQGAADHDSEVLG
ncbi:MAG: FliH/SctL family protein [Candidatus Microbacterium colombiense]|nr:MAG: FliH/SctL family protein [Microbacterium sp.]